jgi:hypothetical protein
MTKEELKNIFRKYNLKVNYSYIIYYVKPDIQVGTFHKISRERDEWGIRFFNTALTVTNPIEVENKLNKMMPYYKRKLLEMKIVQISKDFD